MRFIIDNRSAIAGMVTMALFWFVFNYRSVKGNVEAINKKREELGEPQMTDNEKQIIANVLRSSVVGDAIGAFVGGVVAFVVSTLF